MTSYALTPSTIPSNVSTAPPSTLVPTASPQVTFNYHLILPSLLQFDPSSYPSQTPTVSSQLQLQGTSESGKAPTKPSIVLPQSVAPSVMPSRAPSDAPSMVPSDAPSMLPSDAPSMLPSDAPSMIPSDAPSMLPSDAPSMIPSDAPSMLPSDAPSMLPSGVPSMIPSDAPSMVLSYAPSDTPSYQPTMTPSSISILGRLGIRASDTTQTESVPIQTQGMIYFNPPLLVPVPSDAPSMVPSDAPSMAPSDAPSMAPSDAPSMVPSDSPSAHTYSSSPSSSFGTAIMKDSLSLHVPSDAPTYMEKWVISGKEWAPSGAPTSVGDVVGGHNSDSASVNRIVAVSAGRSRSRSAMIWLVVTAFTTVAAASVLTFIEYF